jgi:hypothetical protein
MGGQVENAGGGQAQQPLLGGLGAQEELGLSPPTRFGPIFTDITEGRRSTPSPTRK